MTRTHRSTTAPLLVLLALVLLGLACTSEPASDGAHSTVEEPDPDEKSTPAAEGAADDDDAPTADGPDWLVELSGDAATTFEVSGQSFNLAAANLTSASLLRFTEGDTTFQKFFDAQNGLGPDFNAAGCNTCHVNNGRQSSPLGNGYVGIGPVVHVSIAGAGPDERPFELPGYGTRLQTYAVEGEAEAQIKVLWEELGGSYPDGAIYSLRRPTVSVVGRDGMLPADAELSLRIPPQVAGPGLLEHVAEADIITRADPDDIDGDGISGRVQWVPNADRGSDTSPDASPEFLVGRHGWKAENFDLTHQSAGALADDMGLGTTVFPVAELVEIDDARLADLAFYMEGLAIPAGRHTDNPEVIGGAALFDSIGCSSCHTPQLRTTNAATPELSDLTIYPFTDMLLHDLGMGLDDGRSVLQASGAEWRTAPLWGIGLLQIVNGHVSLLHDGRARSIEEAILWHGGEAEAASQEFQALTAPNRVMVLAFVASR